MCVSEGASRLSPVGERKGVSASPRARAEKARGEYRCENAGARAIG